MRLSTVLLRCCALLQCAVAKDAYLYIFNDEQRSPSTNPDTISASTAFAIVSRRQGVTDGLSLEGVDGHSLLQISEHGGYQQPLFSEATDTEPSRVLVRIQASIPDISRTAHAQPNFKIQKPIADLLSLGSQHPNENKYTFRLASKEGVQLLYRIHDKAPILSDQKHLPISNGKPIAEMLDVTKSYLSNSMDLVSASVDVDFTHSKVSQSSVDSHINLFIDYLHSISTDKYQPTLLILPPTSEIAASTICLTKRQDLEEEPLDLTIPSIVDSSFDSSSMYKKNTTLPRRFPSCFSSQESCRNGTNDCSGHGSCQASSSSKNCFQCKCGRTTIRTNKDGSKKTNLWAGAACQKKDISVEFTLFAVFGVTMAMLIAGVIGMMYSMGAQDLPSVIGAGVAGPTARK